MDQATRARLFEPFFTTKPHDRGTGLGLASVNGIVRAAGGHILVDTEVGDGTVMTVLLPVADPVAAPLRSLDESHHGSTVPAPPHGVATILVVDDELSLRRAVVRFFTRLGYEVIEAADGLSALAELERREWAVDLVLTDVEMPGINGLELANRIRQRAPAMLILYMSGFVDSRTASGDVAADDGIVLMKPFDFAVLVERVRDALATRAR
jgi:two-component system cell cycle sensor histidine kinase/response regulator CckA